MLRERKTGLAVIVFVNLPAAVSTFILAICGCTGEREALGGVELADGCVPASPVPRTHARTNSRSPGATGVGCIDVNGRRVEPVPSERPRCVCSPRFFVPSVKATQEILRSLPASPVSTTRRRSANSGQSHCP